MALKPRSISYDLGVMRSLDTRMDLSAEDHQHYLNLEKGYQGEVMFDQISIKLQNDMLIINDLCLEFNNSVFQIDTIIIAQEKIFLIEVKNYEGDYTYDGDSFKTLAKKEILNPLDQLNRSRILLQQVLRSLGFQIPLEGYVVFINPSFTLYHAPLNLPIIFPTQLERFMKKLDQTPAKLNSRHGKIAGELIAMHNPKSPRIKLPPYRYEQMKKSIICSECFCFMVYDGNRKLLCEKCGFEEHIDSGILRSAEEIKLLFPDKKITTLLVHDWCKIIGSKKMIGRILKQNYRMMSFGQWTYYE